MSMIWKTNKLELELELELESKGSVSATGRRAVKWEFCCVQKNDGVEKVPNFENDIASLK